MELKNTQELLCVKGTSRSYAFEFPYITEICPEVQISKIPGLPKQFLGVCSHKGEIVPVICMEDMVQDNKELILIISCHGFSLGIVCQGTVYITPAQQVTEVQSPETVVSGNFWSVKGMLQSGKELYTVIDLEKTVLEMARYFQEEYLYF